MDVRAEIAAVTARIIERSRADREAYLARIEAAAARGVSRGRLGCANLAHGFAACGAADKAALTDTVMPNLGIVTA